MRLKVLACGFCAVTLSASADETIVDFSRPEDAKGAVVVLPAGHAQVARSAKPLPEEGVLRFSVASNSASWVSFNFPAFGSNVKAIPVERRSGDFLWRYRVRVAPEKGCFNATFRLAGGLRYQVNLPILSAEGVNTFVMHAALGWNRQKIPFDPSKIESVSLVVVGACEIDLLSVSFLPPEPAVALPDEGLPPVDPESFCLYPEPRIATVSDDAVPLVAFGSGYETLGDVPSGAIAAFVGEMKSFYGLDYRPERGAKVVLARADDPEARRRIASRGLAADFAKIRFDGYAVVVDDAGVLVAANEPSGLYFGAQTLAEAVKMTSGDAGPAAVRKLRVVDWPRLGIRPFQDMVRTHGHKNKYEVPFYSEMLRRVVFGSRFNMVGLELGAFYRWASAPDIPTVPQAWTRKDLEGVVDFANSCGMVVYPRMNGLGHVGHWPLAGRREVELYGEDGTTAVLCTAKPAANRMLLDTCAEVLGVCSKNAAFRPRHFHMGLDEVRWDTYSVPETQRCERCRGRAKNAIFLEQVKVLRDWCVSNDTRMVMCADMVNRYHNGLNRFRCAEILKDVPRDVILDGWARHDAYEIDEHARDGFENWKLLTEYSDDPHGESALTGRGLNSCIYNWWLTHAGPYGLLAQRLLADSTWRAAPVRHQAERKAKIARWAGFLMRNWSRKPIPRATERFETVALNATSDLTTDLPDVTRFGPVPVALCGRKGAFRVVEAVLSNAVPIAVNRRAASLCLLHAVHVDEKDLKAFTNGRRTGSPSEGIPVAEGLVRYADGTTARLDVRYGWNVADWVCPDAINGGVWALYPIDCRAAWRGERNAATLHEWVNPHPDREIVALELRRTDSLARYVLWALTVRAPSGT